MSKQRDLERERAKFAWEKIQKIKNNPSDEVKSKYGTLAQKASADIQTNGLGQTLAFWRARATPKERGKESPENIAHGEILKHIEGWLNKDGGMKLGKNDLVDWITNVAKTNDYRRATIEATAFFIWLKRFAESELPRDKES